MSDLFKAEPAKNTHGAFSISFTGSSDIVKNLKKLDAAGEKAIKRTVSECATRAPGWISKGIRQHYGVDTDAIKEAAGRPKRGRTSISIAGTVVDGITLEYSGRTLTPTHFKMSPKKIHPRGFEKNESPIPGQRVNREELPHTKKKSQDIAMAAIPKPYTVKATIVKGQRVALPTEAYLAPSPKGGGILPFQKTPNGKHTVEAIHTLSVPQMIDGRARETIEQKINDAVSARFQHNLNQALK